MIFRNTATIFLAATVVFASFAAAASAQTMHHSTSRHPHATMHHATRGHSGASRNAGSAATDQLNEQSLNSARNGVAPMSGQTPMSGQMPTQMPAQSPVQ